MGPGKECLDLQLKYSNYVFQLLRSFYTDFIKLTKIDFLLEIEEKIHDYSESKYNIYIDLAVDGRPCHQSIYTYISYSQ